MWLFTRLFIHSPNEEAMERTAAILLVTFFLFSNQRSPIDKENTEFYRRINREGNLSQCTKSWAQNLAISAFFSPEISHPDPVYVVYMDLTMKRFKY